MINQKVLDKIKILAFDVDDTLLNQDNVLSVKNRSIITRAVEKGYCIVLATGRVLTAIPLELMEMEGIQYAVTSNGARVSELHNIQTIYTNFLEKEEIEKIMPFLLDPTIMKEVFYDNRVYADEHCLADLPRYGILNPWNKHYISTTRTPVESTISMIQANMDCLENINLTFPTLEKRDHCLALLKETTSLALFPSPPFCDTSDVIEIGGRTASKAEALQALAQILDTGEGSIMAFGDSCNDVQMLKAAAVGVAMGNAVPEAKEVADFITRSNAQDGVAIALKVLLDI